MVFISFYLVLISFLATQTDENAKKLTYYISNDGSMTNDGSYEKPFSFQWASILRQLNKLDAGTDVTLVWKEGDYYVTEYGITFNDKNGHRPGHITLKPEDGKRVRIIGGVKLPQNSWEKVHDDRYKDRLWKLDPKNFNFKPKAIYINDHRAIFARAPKYGTIARIRSFEAIEDPEDSSYTLRNFGVQPDCIEMLETLSADELEVARFIFFRGEKQYSETIYKIDKEKGFVITRIFANESKIRAGVVGDFYYIENVVTCVGNSEEIIQMKNGSILYLAKNSEIDLNSESSETFLQSSDSYFGFHSSKRGNIEIYNFEILNVGCPLYFSYDPNVHFENLTMSHCNEGPQIQQCENVTIQHCLIQDMGGRLAYISKTDGVLINDSIIKTGGIMTPASQGIWFGRGNNNTVISNNEIADSYQSLIQIDGADGYNMEKFLSFKLINNHLHHCGKNIFDDMGGIQILNHCRGIVVEHNWIHDIYAPRHAGQAICSCSGTAGTIVRNNLVYDSTQLAFKMDTGCNVTVENNIFGPGYYGVIGWTNKAPEYHALDMKHNILIYNSTALIGDFNKNGINISFDKNIYWNTRGADLVDFRTMSFDQWKSKGNDINSHIVDPFFTDFEKRDFSFASDKSYKLIGFEPFDLEFGVIGSNEWREKAKENIGPSRTGEKGYVSRFYFPSLLQMSGFEDFENGGESHSEFWKSQTRLVPQKFTIGISNEKSFGGEYSLRFGPTGYELKSKQPYLQIQLDWNNGKVQFGFKMFLDETAWFSLRFNSALKIDFMKGKVVYNSNEVLDYQCNKWDDVKITIDVDEKNFDVNVDGSKCNYIDQNIQPITVIYLYNFDSRTASYFDDFNATSLYIEPNLFSCEICDEEKEPLEISSIGSDSIESSDGENDKNKSEYTVNESDEINDNESKTNNEENVDPPQNSNNKMKSGIIAAIVISIIVVVAAIVAVVLFIIKKKNKQESSDIVHIDDSSI